jgi:hypothetical protein
MLFRTSPTVGGSFVSSNPSPIWRMAAMTSSSTTTSSRPDWSTRTSLIDPWTNSRVFAPRRRHRSALDAVAGWTDA